MAEDMGRLIDFDGPFGLAAVATSLEGTHDAADGGRLLRS